MSGIAMDLSHADIHATAAWFAGNSIGAATPCVVKKKPSVIMNVSAAIAPLTTAAMGANARAASNTPVAISNTLSM